jgi:hypothetical protein
VIVLGGGVNLARFVVVGPGLMWNESATGQKVWLTRGEVGLALEAEY